MSISPPGECELLEHKSGCPNAGTEERTATLLPADYPGHGVRGEIPRIHPQQLPQPATLLAAALPQQGQRQHLFRECECHLILHQLSNTYRF